MPQYSPRFIQKLAIQVKHLATPDFAVPVSYSLFRSMAKVMKPTPTHIICGAEVWSMLLSDQTIGALVDPAMHSEEVERGYFGTFMDCDVVSDSFMAVEHRMIPSNFCALVALHQRDCDTWAHECPLVNIDCSKAVLLCR